MTTIPTNPMRHRSKVPNLLFKIGALVAIASLIMVILGGVLLGDRSNTGANDAALIRHELATEIAVPDIVDVRLEAGTYDIVAIGQNLVRRDEITRGDPSTAYRARTGFREPVVAIDRNGFAVATRQATGTTLLPQDGYDLVRLSTFDVTSAGTYRIVVAGDQGPVATIGIGETADGDAASEATGGLLLEVGLLGLTLGVLLLIAAGIWLYSGRKHRRPPRSGRPPAGSPPPAPDPDGFGGIYLPADLVTDHTTGPGSTPPPPPPPRRPPPPSLHHGNQPPGPSV